MLASSTTDVDGAGATASSRGRSDGASACRGFSGCAGPSGEAEFCGVATFAGGNGLAGATVFAGGSGLAGATVFEGGSGLAGATIFEGEGGLAGATAFTGGGGFSWGTTLGGGAHFTGGGSAFTAGAEFDESKRGGSRSTWAKRGSVGDFAAAEARGKPGPTSRWAPGSHEPAHAFERKRTPRVNAITQDDRILTGYSHGKFNCDTRERNEGRKFTKSRVMLMGYTTQGGEKDCALGAGDLVLSPQPGDARIRECWRGAW